MILISHRGNISGKQADRENEPSYILEALEKGYNVEVDVWYQEDKIYLGHDLPQYETTVEFLRNGKIWCHCKDIEALSHLLKNNVHCFFHKSDDVTLTSKGFMWVFPRKKFVQGSICVMPELGYFGNLNNCLGICSDYIENFNG